MSLLRTLLNQSSIGAGRRPPPDSITILSNKDSTVDAWNSGTNYGGDPTVVVTSFKYLGQPRDWRALVSFPLTSIPGGASIESATLKLYAFTTGGAGRTYQVHRITGAWTEMGVTWNNQPAVSPTPVEGDAPSVGGFWEIDVTDIFEMDSFIGLRVKDKVETEGAVKETDFYSRERAGTAQDPRLVVEYYS